MDKQKLSGVAFAKLFKAHFYDFYPKLSDFGVNADYLESDRGLAVTTMLVVSYYAGRLESDARWTKTFSGPVTHHNAELIKYLYSNNVQRLLDDDKTVDLHDWIGRQNCYKLLSKLGLRK